MRTLRLTFLGVLVLLFGGSQLSAALKLKPKKQTAAQLRADYLTRLQQTNLPLNEEHTVGSLWTAQSDLGDFATDYKARRVNDTVTIEVSVQTTAAQSGTVATQRDFSTNSAVTGVMGRTPASTNPLLAANSSTSLKGSGQTSSATNFLTSMTGQVIAVLPSGNLAVEAEREIFMNNQHEHVIVSGLVRPGDISPNNVVASTSLSNLEIEMKGKGIISDGTRPPNPITRAILWLFGF